MTFDPTISLGHLAEVFIVLAAGLGLIYTLKANVAALKEAIKELREGDIKELRKDVDKITEILTTMARQDERLKTLERLLPIPPLTSN